MAPEPNPDQKQPQADSTTWFTVGIKPTASRRGRLRAMTPGAKGPPVPCVTNAPAISPGGLSPGHERHGSAEAKCRSPLAVAEVCKQQGVERDGE